jgi:hypothetical protein
VTIVGPMSKAPIDVTTMSVDKSVPNLTRAPREGCVVVPIAHQKCCLKPKTVGPLRQGPGGGAASNDQSEMLVCDSHGSIFGPLLSNKVNEAAYMMSCTAGLAMEASGWPG